MLTLEKKYGPTMMSKLIRSLLKARPAKGAPIETQSPVATGSTNSNSPVSATQSQHNTAKRSISTRGFLRLLKTLTSMEHKNVADLWVYGSGHPNIFCGFDFNRKRKLDFALKLDTRGRPPGEKLSGNITVRVHELDGTFVQDIEFDSETNLFEFPCHSRMRKARRKKGSANVPAASSELLDEVDAPGAKREIPIMWIRVEPEFECIRRVYFKQSESMWISQLEMDKDVRAQAEAIEALTEFPSATTIAALDTFLSDDKAFWAVRSAAALAIAKLTASQSVTPDICNVAFEALSSFYRSHFCESSAESDEAFPKPNNFSDFALYQVQKAIPIAIGSIVGTDGFMLPRALKFLLFILKSNDNTRNPFSDAEFLASCIVALGKSPMNTNSSLDLNRVVKQLERFLALEQLEPSPNFVITCACISVMCTMQSDSRQLVDTSFFWKFVNHPYYFF